MTPTHWRPAPVVGGRGAVVAGSDQKTVADDVRLVDLTTGDLQQLVRAEIGAALGELASAVEPAAVLVDKRGLAHALSVSTATIDRLTRAGDLPFILVGDHRRYDLHAVRAALETRASMARPGPGPARAGLGGVRLLSRARQ